MARSGSSSADTQPARPSYSDSDAAFSEDTDVFSIDEPLDGEEVDGALNDAQLATRNGREAFRAGDFEAALVYFEELAQLSPTNYTAFLYEGLLIEYGATEQLFTNPSMRQTEDYITGRFG